MRHDAYQNEAFDVAGPGAQVTCRLCVTISLVIDTAVYLGTYTYDRCCLFSCSNHSP